MLTADILFALAGVALASTWTPGPNNLMLANSGATFGFRATIGHVLGVAIGFPAMMFTLAFGLGEAFQQSAVLREALRWVGVAVMLWLSWRIAGAGRAKARSDGRPLSFLEAAVFQWVNPKAWAMALAMPAAFMSGARPALESLVCALIFLGSGLTSASGWAAFGAALRTALATDVRLRAFNWTMGTLLAISAVYLLVADL